MEHKKIRYKITLKGIVQKKKCKRSIIGHKMKNMVRYIYIYAFQILFNQHTKYRNAMMNMNDECMVVVIMSIRK